MRLIYVADPMCSWCYGFGPQLADLRARLADTLGAPVPVTLVTGGLRPGQREPLPRPSARRSCTTGTPWPSAAACRSGTRPTQPCAGRASSTTPSPPAASW